MELTGKTAIVTGGSRGIGRAIAGSLVTAGANVVLCGRAGTTAATAAQELAAAAPGGGEVAGWACDVREHQECHGLIQKTVDRFGRLDILVNNAGIGLFAPVADIAPEDWRALMATNLDGVFYCSHEAIPALRRSGGGWIINIGSLAGKNAFPGGAAYNASKFGLIGFSEALMQEIRHEGIRVSYIMPGSVATEFSHPTGTRRDDAWKIQPEDVAQIVMDLLRTPVRTLPSRVEVRPSRPPKR